MKVLRGLSWGKNRQEGERGKERIMRGEEDECTLHMCVYIHMYIYVYIYEDSIMKPTKHCLKESGGRKRMGIQWRG
jgi:hypothetical protein